MKLLGLIVASVSAFGGMVGGRGGMPPAYLFVEDYDKVNRHAIIEKILSLTFKHN